MLNSLETSGRIYFKIFFSVDSDFINVKPSSIHLYIRRVLFYTPIFMSLNLYEKQTVKEVTLYLSGENVRLTEWQNPQELIEIKAETQKLIATVKYVSPDSDSHQAFEHKYQRYEWLLKQKDLSEENKIWIKNYENTSEYEEIYT